MGEESKVKDTVEAVKGIVEAVPNYQDALQPAAKELGKGLQTIAKSIHVALVPISILVFCCPVQTMSRKRDSYFSS